MRLTLSKILVGGLIWFVGATAAFADSVTTYQYDALGRLTQVTYPDGGTVTYSYDAAGNRTQVSTTPGTTPPTVQVIVLPLMGGVVIKVN